MAEFIQDQTIDWDELMQDPPEASRILPATEWQYAVIDDVWGDNPDPGSVWPWGKTHNLFKHRPGELTLWGGYSRHRKSMVLGNILLGFLRNKERCCIASLEMQPRKTLGRMARQAIGTVKPTGEFIGRFFKNTENKLWLYDQTGVVHYQKMIGLTRYAFRELHVTHMIIDSYMKCGIGTKDFDSATRFIDSLQALAKEYDKHVHLVIHARKPPDHSGDSKIPTIYDIAGIADITNQTDNVVMVWANKPKFDKLRTKDFGKKSQEEIEELPDMLLGVDKQRNGDWEGKIALWFHPESLQHIGAYGAGPIDFIANDQQQDWV